MTVDEALEIVRENYRDDTSAGVLAAEVRRLRAELDRYCGECGGCDAHFKGCTNTEDVTSADGSELEQHR